MRTDSGVPVPPPHPLLLRCAVELSFSASGFRGLPHVRGVTRGLSVPHPTCCCPSVTFDLGLGPTPVPTLRETPSVLSAHLHPGFSASQGSVALVPDYLIPVACALPAGLEARVAHWSQAWPPRAVSGPRWVQVPLERLPGPPSPPQILLSSGGPGYLQGFVVMAGSYCPGADPLKAAQRHTLIVLLRTGHPYAVRPRPDEASETEQTLPLRPQGSSLHQESTREPAVGRLGQALGAAPSRAFRPTHRRSEHAASQ